MSTFKEIIQSEKPVLVDFFATWCGPCKMMTPILKQLKEDLGNAVTIIKIDIDKEPQAASALGIQGVPTLMIFQKGRQKWRQSGVLDARQLKHVLQPFI